jgi:hypothetical protein
MANPSKKVRKMKRAMAPQDWCARARTSCRSTYLQAASRSASSVVSTIHACTTTIVRTLKAKD